ncbi:nucleotidyltransferase family protein [Mycobacterium riyadhense]|uniref:Nucleotidyltransferase n=1 Tax=Mycobacterium riyadhense TaxID=486698 RepID=A0A1X2CV01_9MYCO|nr:nucleotidyltransferase family protein [Mycobacterium riyadhense]MCV7147006.1 nucleotidyltransferase family protein [Mycobacterium riyadhense]ORW79752.1 hypothetical protein AWC22_18605 [Mycobacterium riyadhense]VTP00406.1 hypothetical protein BIN_B_03508 [Mycobacterium riyadhense]
MSESHAKWWGLGERERSLILLCIGRDRERDHDIVDLARMQCDWNAIFMSSLWHKVAFLVYARLRETGALDIAMANGNLPLLLLNHWKQLTKVNEIRSELYASAAAELCAAATAHGVDLVVAKGGIAMFGTIYTKYERKTYDVDFLARPGQTRLIEQVFGECGFRYGAYNHSEQKLYPQRPGELRRHLLQGRGLPNFMRAEGGVIDYLIAQVRFRVGANSRTEYWVSADPLIDASETRDQIRVVNWCDLGLQMGLHIYREAHEHEHRQLNHHVNLIKFCDFDRVLNSRGSDFADDVYRRACEFGFAEELGFAAASTNIFLPSAISAELADRCAAKTELGLDVAEMTDEVWSTGLNFEGQRGGWLDFSGPKIT